MVGFLKWRAKSASTGKRWAIAVDEPGKATIALLPDDKDPSHNEARGNALWGTLMDGWWLWGRMVFWLSKPEFGPDLPGFQKPGSVLGSKSTRPLLFRKLPPILGDEPLR